MTDYLHLTIPEDSDEAKEIRDIDGYNDLERLRKWANRRVKQDVQKELEESLKNYLDNQIERLTINQRTGEIELR